MVGYSHYDTFMIQSNRLTVVGLDRVGAVGIMVAVNRLCSNCGPMSGVQYSAL